MGCKPYDAVYAIPGQHIASSVGVFDLGSEIPSGPGESWVLGGFTVYNTMHGGFLLWLIGKKLEKSLPVFFFLSLPCGSRIHGLKSHPGLNLLCLSSWDKVVDLSFSDMGVADGCAD